MVWTLIHIKIVTEHKFAFYLVIIEQKIKSVNLDELTSQNSRTIYTSKLHINASSKVVS